MKLQKYLFIICLVSISKYSYSQDKGYYSIGKNKEKLHNNSGNMVPDNFVRAEKGYYNMEPNRRKLKKSVGVQKAGYRRIPLVNKGYYSIGNNSGRLSEN